MKTLQNPRDKQQVISRLGAVRPTSSRLWGKMSAHQMVCHLSDGFRMYMGLKPANPARLPYPRSVLKCVALWAPSPWPKVFKTVPELAVASGTLSNLDPNGQPLRAQSMPTAPGGGSFHRFPF